MNDTIDPARRRPSIAVVIPSFRAASTIHGVLSSIGPEVSRIYVVDDCCPEGTGESVRRHALDPRVTVLSHPNNLGVGGAMKTGYRHALAGGASIVVKIDADGQMDPSHVPRLVEPILEGRADYSKGDRLARRHLMPGACNGGLERMPLPRKLANRLLSAMHKPATGYWRVSDPANGYTAVSASTLGLLDLNALADCFFFETDMLFQLGLIDARIADVPLPALYPTPFSNLRLLKVAPRFAALLVHRAFQRTRARAIIGKAVLEAVCRPRPAAGLSH